MAAAICRELVALLLSNLAALLSIVAISMPTWSTSALSPSTPKAAFTAGVWGLCFHTANEPALNNCFGYNRAIDYNITLAKVQGVCEMYSTSTLLSTTAGIPNEAFTRFMDNVCGSHGTAALVLAGFGVACGLLAALALVLHVTICKRKLRSLPRVALWSLGLSCVFGIAALGTWAAIAGGLAGSGVAFGASFLLQVFAVALGAVALGMLAWHTSPPQDFSQLLK
ncbi:hypothetical protein SDRG_06959 [Saprolegnia diclina VS20]|uniref:Claudin n=1 Tax=Saprolegnia diclina (strain VS20) TaxID=1156394 RepID=T0RZ95_SAPDV|nr:hypothetical protein SDRG_06959 [Saprolegnia diclina VS20]EQC35677.1 hypothetical protein SDRG_06959 [Saprolegnia diclina VS20]|eukprot:XP_008610994.1 hypothetical protein SDRG_06959 [Saprolegnia diclina VS20]